MSAPEGSPTRKRSDSTPPSSPSSGRRPASPTPSVLVPPTPAVQVQPRASPTPAVSPATPSLALPQQTSPPERSASQSFSPPVLPSAQASRPQLQVATDHVVNLAQSTVNNGPSSSGRRDSLSRPLLLPNESSALLPSPRGSVQQDHDALAPAPAAAPSRVSTPRGFAEGLDLAAAVASFPVGSGAMGATRGVASGALWAGSAVASGVDDYRQGSRLGGVGDVLGGVAGAADTVNSAFNYLSSSAHDTFSQVGAWGGYVSNVSWAASGVVSSFQAIGNLRSGAQSRIASGLQLAGGLLNTAGAAAGFEATRLTAQDPTDSTATYWGIASAAAWTVGSLATLAGNHLAVRSQNTARQPDLEAQ